MSAALRTTPTQGKIERWHQTLKNRILLENHYLPGALEAAIADFVEHYNHRRCHESLGNSEGSAGLTGRRGGRATFLGWLPCFPLARSSRMLAPRMSYAET